MQICFILYFFIRILRIFLFSKSSFIMKMSKHSYWHIIFFYRNFAMIFEFADIIVLFFTHLLKSFWALMRWFFLIFISSEMQFKTTFLKISEIQIEWNSFFWCFIQSCTWHWKQYVITLTLLMFLNISYHQYCCAIFLYILSHSQ